MPDAAGTVAAVGTVAPAGAGSGVGGQGSTAPVRQLSTCPALLSTARTVLPDQAAPPSPRSGGGGGGGGGWTSMDSDLEGNTMLGPTQDLDRDPDTDQHLEIAEVPAARENSHVESSLRGRLVFRGLRVRMGCSSGVDQAVEVSYNSRMARMIYTGRPIAIARAVGGAASGGMVLLSETSHALVIASTLEQYDRDSPWALLGKAPQFVHLGHHLGRRNHDKARKLSRNRRRTYWGEAGGAAANAAGSHQEVFWYGGCVRLDDLLPDMEVYQAATPVQALRWALLPPPTTRLKRDPLSAGVQAALVGNLAVAVVAVSAAPAIAALDCELGKGELWREVAHAMWLEAARLCRVGGGFLATRRSAFVDLEHEVLARKGGSSSGQLLITAAFLDATAAVVWASELITACLLAPWPPQLLDSELGDSLWVETPEAATGPPPSLAVAPGAVPKSYDGKWALRPSLGDGVAGPGGSPADARHVVHLPSLGGGSARSSERSTPADRVPLSISGLLPLALAMPGRGSFSGNNCVIAVTPRSMSLGGAGGGTIKGRRATAGVHPQPHPHQAHPHRLATQPPPTPYAQWLGMQQGVEQADAVAPLTNLNLSSRLVIPLSRLRQVSTPAGRHSGPAPAAPVLTLAPSGSSMSRGGSGGGGVVVGRVNSYGGSIVVGSGSGSRVRQTPLEVPGGNWRQRLRLGGSLLGNTDLHPVLQEGVEAEAVLRGAKEGAEDKHEGPRTSTRDVPGGTAPEEEEEAEESITVADLCWTAEAPTSIRAAVARAFAGAGKGNGDGVTHTGVPLEVLSIVSTGPTDGDPDLVNSVVGCDAAPTTGRLRLPTEPVASAGSDAGVGRRARTANGTAATEAVPSVGAAFPTAHSLQGTRTRPPPLPLHPLQKQEQPRKLSRPLLVAVTHGSAPQPERQTNEQAAACGGPTTCRCPCHRAHHQPHVQPQAQPAQRQWRSGTGTSPRGGAVLDAAGSSEPGGGNAATAAASRNGSAAGGGASGDGVGSIAAVDVAAARAGAFSDTVEGAAATAARSARLLSGEASLSGFDTAALPPQLLQALVCRGPRLRAGVELGLAALEVCGVTGAPLYDGPAAAGATTLALSSPVSRVHVSPAVAAALRHKGVITSLSAAAAAAIAAPSAVGADHNGTAGAELGGCRNGCSACGAGGAAAVAATCSSLSQGGGGDSGAVVAAASEGYGDVNSNPLPQPRLQQHASPSGAATAAAAAATWLPPVALLSRVVVRAQGMEAVDAPSPPRPHGAAGSRLFTFSGGNRR